MISVLYIHLMVLLNEFKMNSWKDVEDTRVHIISH